MKTTVSLLIPCHNAERWIDAAISSSLAQTWPETEIIVLDDGSTDGSLEIIRGFGDQVQWESSPNRGGGTARNRLLELAGGEWVQYLDADDWLMPRKIERQAASLPDLEQADIVFGAVTLEHWSPEGSRLEHCPIPEPHDPYVLLARWRLPQTGAPLFRKQALLDVGGWTKEQPCCQEHELYLRLLMAGKCFAYTECDGAVYRLWSEETLCRRDKALTRRERRKITDRLEAHLEDTGRMTAERQWAINQARFEMARMAWLSNPTEATEILAEIRRSQPGFRPAESAAPPAYLAAYRALGFGAAETLAALKRRVTAAWPN
jgi:glycosyltransferase involved in cell wall biosynthesis